MDDKRLDEEGLDVEFDNCVGEHLRSLGWHGGWSDAPDELFEEATSLAELELKRKRLRDSN